MALGELRHVGPGVRERRRARDARGRCDSRRSRRARRAGGPSPGGRKTGLSVTEASEPAAVRSACACASRTPPEHARQDAMAHRRLMRLALGRAALQQGGERAPARRPRARRPTASPSSGANAVQRRADRLDRERERALGELEPAPPGERRVGHERGRAGRSVDQRHLLPRLEVEPRRRASPNRWPSARISPEPPLPRAGTGGQRRRRRASRPPRRRAAAVRPHDRRRGWPGARARSRARPVRAAARRTTPRSTARAAGSRARCSESTAPPASPGPVVTP